MIHVVVPHRELAQLARALDDEADGEEFRADLARNIHRVLEPAVAEARSAVLSMAGGGLEHAGEPLRASVAAATESHVRVTARSGVVSIRARKNGMPRRFYNAAKRLNSRKGWRHQVFGRDVWVQQIGQPGWFDDVMDRRGPGCRLAVKEAMQDMAARVARSA